MELYWYITQILRKQKGNPMCRSIKTLYNYDPPATKDEIEAAALQFVRKLSGFQKPSTVNEIAFNKAVKQVAIISSELLSKLTTSAKQKNREEQADKARIRYASR